MDSNGTSVEFPYIITIILYVPHFTGGFPWFSGWKPWLFPRSRVLSQEFDLPPALRQGLQLLKVDAAVAVAVQAAEQQALLGQRQPIHGHLR
jgi:hypothetical protein